MRRCMCVRRLRHGSVRLCRWSRFKYGAVFVYFLILIFLLHLIQLRLQLRLEPAPPCLQVKNENVKTPSIWPQIYEREDRILLQLAYKLKKLPKKQKLIYTESEPKFEFQTFENDHCAVDQCRFTADDGKVGEADIVIVNTRYSPFFTHPVASNQIKILYELESPMHMSRNVKVSYNWTATYRLDSTIVTPYEKFVHFNNFTKLPERPRRNYALGKTKQVAWFVSNCMDKNGRLAYGRELNRHVSVDIYGACGPFRCLRQNKDFCFSLLKKRYKFYLAFENSNCRDYITEKLYWNAYLNDIVPVVMGAAPEDYRKVAPPHSYIHVDDFASPRELAAYLHKLDANDTLYNEYFRWKGTGHFINTKFWCRVCAMAHAADEHEHKMWYENVNKWADKDCQRWNPLVAPWVSWRNVSLSRRYLKYEYLVRHQEPSRPSTDRCSP